MRIIYPHAMVFPNKMAHSIQIIHTCWELASHGNEVHLLVKKIAKKSIHECLQVYGLPEHKNLFIYGKKEKLRRLIYYFTVISMVWKHRKNSDTIIYTRDKRIARLLIFCKWITKIPCIFESHDLAHLTYQDNFYRKKDDFNLTRRLKRKLKVWKYYRLEKYIYQKVDGIICQAAGIEKEIRKRFQISAPVEIIYSATGFKPRIYKDGRQDILYLGQLYPVKGTDILVESLKYLPGRRLIIIGGNQEEDILRTRGLCDRLGVSDRVEITGYIEPRELEKYFDRIGVGVLPILDVLDTRLFTSPLKLFDYMAAKIPIVASDLPSVSEVLKHGETAILVEPNSPKKLAEGLELVLSNKKLAQKISEQAYQKSLNYTWEKRAENIVSFSRKILNMRTEGLA